MNDVKRDSLKTQLVIRQLTRSDSHDLISAGFPFGNSVLRPFLHDKIFQAFNLYPLQTRLVAYDINKKRAISYLSLVIHTRSLGSIRYVFTDPNFRQKGIATSLINYSLVLAKNKGTKKAFLTVERLSSASKLYEKLGFKILSEYPILEGSGFTTSFQHVNQNHLITLQPCSQKNWKEIFRIYKDSMGQELIEFFEININNFINGYSQDFRHFFVKNAFVSDSKESLALVFHLPLTHKAFAELYSQSSLLFPGIIKALMNTLYRRGIKYARISLFNTKGQKCFNLLEENGFYPHQGVFMGRSI